MLMCWKQKNGPAEGFRRRSVKLQWLKTAASAGVCWCIRQTWPFRCIMESVCVCLWYDFLSLMLAFDSQVSDCHLMGSDATDNAWHSSGDHPSIHPCIHFLDLLFPVLVAGVCWGLRWAQRLFILLDSGGLSEMSAMTSRRDLFQIFVQGRKKRWDWGSLQDSQSQTLEGPSAPQSLIKCTELQKTWFQSA